LETGGLVELPIGFDWFAKRKGVRLKRDEAGAILADKVKHASAPVGVMFHHALMEIDESKAAGELLSLLADHERARPYPMRALIETLAASSTVKQR
jgi:hypothetical protein